MNRFFDEGEKGSCRQRQARVIFVTALLILLHAFLCCFPGVFASCRGLLDAHTDQPDLAVIRCDESRGE